MMQSSHVEVINLNDDLSTNPSANNRPQTYTPTNQDISQYNAEDTSEEGGGVAANQEAFSPMAPVWDPYSSTVLSPDRVKWQTKHGRQMMVPVPKNPVLHHKVLYEQGATTPFRFSKPVDDLAAMNYGQEPEKDLRQGGNQSSMYHENLGVWHRAENVKKSSQWQPIPAPGLDDPGPWLVDKFGAARTRQAKNLEDLQMSAASDTHWARMHEPMSPVIRVKQSSYNEAFEQMKAAQNRQRQRSSERAERRVLQSEFESPRLFGDKGHVIKRHLQQQADSESYQYVEPGIEYRNTLSDDARSTAYVVYQHQQKQFRQYGDRGSSSFFPSGSVPYDPSKSRIGQVPLTDLKPPASWHPSLVVRRDEPLDLSENHTEATFDRSIGITDQVTRPKTAMANAVVEANRQRRRRQIWANSVGKNLKPDDKPRGIQYNIEQDSDSGDEEHIARKQLMSMVCSGQMHNHTLSAQNDHSMAKFPQTSSDVELSGRGSFYPVANSSNLQAPCGVPKFSMPEPPQIPGAEAQSDYARRILHWKWHLEPGFEVPLSLLLRRFVDPKYHSDIIDYHMCPELLQDVRRLMEGNYMVKYSRKTGFPHERFFRVTMLPPKPGMEPEPMLVWRVHANSTSTIDRVPLRNLVGVTFDTSSVAFQKFKIYPPSYTKPYPHHLKTEEAMQREVGVESRRLEIMNESQGNPNLPPEESQQQQSYENPNDDVTPPSSLEPREMFLEGPLVKAGKNQLLPSQNAFTLWFLDRKQMLPKSVDLVHHERKVADRWVRCMEGLRAINTVSVHQDMDGDGQQDDPRMGGVEQQREAMRWVRQELERPDDGSVMFGMEYDYQD